MKRFKEMLLGFILILYGHFLMVALMMIWTSFLPILWDQSVWLHFGVAILMPFLLYGCIGFIIARFFRNLRRINAGALLFGTMLALGLIVALVMESRNSVVALNLYTLANYPISAFYRNAPDFNWSSAGALSASIIMAYLGLTNGFSLLLRLQRSKEGNKR
jgi:hypothetical protein